MTLALDQLNKKENKARAGNLPNPGDGEALILEENLQSQL